MRKLIALVVLLCSAAGAYAEPQKWCSNGFDKPARIAINGDTMRLTIGGVTQSYTASGTEETAQVFENAAGEIAAITTASTSAEEVGETEILIYRDRVFWPCD